MENLNVFRADWEAAKKNFKRAGDKENFKFSEGVLHGLKAALASGGEPFNKALNHKQATDCRSYGKCAVHDVDNCNKKCFYFTA